MDEADIWMMSESVDMNGLEVPVCTLLLYKFCKKDGDMFEELTNLMKMAYSAGKESK